MNKFTNYKIFKEHNLIYIYLKSRINVTDLKAIMKDLTADEAYSSSFNVIIDLKDALLTVESNEILNFLNFMKNELGVLEKRHEIFVTGSANESVISMIYSIYLNNFNLQTEIYSNIADALEHLNFDRSLEDYLVSEFEQVKQELPTKT